MMNRSHATQGVCGVAIAGAALAASSFDLTGQIAVLGLAGVIMVSGSTYPDIDSEGSHPTKSFGKLSHLLHSVTHLLTQAVYHATLGNRDRAKKGSHRLLTHTALGNILAGLVLVGICYIDRIAAAIAVGFLFGMAVAVWRKKFKWHAVALGGLMAYGTYDPSMLWIWGVAFTLGNAIHCFGDSCTKSGTPWFWPMERDGKRWGNSHALPEWLRIKTGTRNEKVVLALSYVLTLGLVGGIVFISSLV
jgi:hypothetical protein